MNMTSSGTFLYLDRKGSRVLSWIVLALSVGVTLLVRILAENSWLSVLAFVIALVALSILTIPINNQLFLHKAEYELSSEQLVLRLKKETVALAPSEVTKAACEPVYDKKVKTAESVLYWRVSLSAGERQYEFCSETVNNSSKEVSAHVEELVSFGQELKRWSKGGGR